MHVCLLLYSQIFSWDKVFAYLYILVKKFFTIGVKFTSIRYALTQEKKKMLDKIFTNVSWWWNWQIFSPGENFWLYSIIIRATSNHLAIICVVTHGPKISGYNRKGGWFEEVYNVWGLATWSLN